MTIKEKKNIKEALFNNSLYRFFKFFYDPSYEPNLTQLSDETGIRYSYLHKMLSFLEKENIVKSFKEGRQRYISLTSKGQKIANSIKKIDEVDKNGT